MEHTFGTVFFPIYDRKIAAGEISFSQLGMSKEDFTRICTEKNFVPDRKTIEKLCRNMHVTEEEKAGLMEFAD